MEDLVQFGQNIVTEVAQRAEQTWNYSVKVFEGVYLSGLTIPFGDGGQVSLLALLITTTVEWKNGRRGEGRGREEGGRRH